MNSTDTRIDEVESLEIRLENSYKENDEEDDDEKGPTKMSLYRSAGPELEIFSRQKSKFWVKIVIVGQKSKF